MSELNKKNENITDQEMELFRQESMQAVEGVKIHLQERRSARRRNLRFALACVIIFVAFVGLYPGALNAMLNMFFAPFRHGPQHSISGIGFTTGGITHSSESTRRWIDDVRVYEWKDENWVLNFSDDFEQDVIGDLPMNWDVSNQCPPDTDLYIDVAGVDSQDVDFSKSVALVDTLTDNCGAIFSRAFTEKYDGLVAIEWSIRHETTEESTMVEIKGDRGPYGPFSVSMKGNDPNHPKHRGWIVMDTKDPVTGEEISPRVMQWQPDRWYRFRVEIDLSSQEFNLFVDGVLMKYENGDG